MKMNGLGLRLVLLALLIWVPATAEEGMWTPAQLPELATKLKSLGLELDPDNLSDLLSHPMNAVISLGGCTASFVSPEGLAVTNHHCARGAIQYNSTEEKNYLEDGFIAGTQTEEVFAGPGSRILVTVEVKDVTNQVLGGLETGLSGRKRFQAIENKEKELVAVCEEDTGHRCRVSSFHGGLQYQLIKQLEIRDVRLVYAPPDSVGRYGGDIDNWMWPRHTGDFSFYRAYVGPDGQPADHDEKNVPFRPKHHLEIASHGLKNGDFVMAAGYPGRTNRHRLATEVDNTIQWVYPERKDFFNEILDVVGQATAEDVDASIKYAGLVSSLNNVSKNYQGMLDGFAKSDIVQEKKQLESDLQGWIEDNPESMSLSAMRDLEALVVESRAHQQRDLFYGFGAQRSSLLRAANTLYRLSMEKEKPDMEREPGYQERDFGRIEERLTRLDRSFTPAVDRTVWRYLVLRYGAIPPDQHVEAFDQWFAIKGNKVDEKKLDGQLDSMYQKTTLDELETRLAWMDKTPKEFKKSKDPFVQLAVHLYDSDMAMEESEKDLAGRLQEARPRYMAALIAYLDSKGQPIYPDANSTLRVTFGSVMGSAPKDGVVYTPFTSLEGIVEKNTGESPFNTPESLLEDIAAKEYGRYEDSALGSVPVNFLATLDSTGGNSGSPTLNSRGKLVGLLFDGTYESIIADWDFIEEQTRSIMVDMRYVLWVMEKSGGAGHLLKEMSIPAGS